jgi:hypothetical protein
MNENPDAEIEAFWLQLKTSMNNFYETNQNIKRPIPYWCSILNNYQKIQNYEKIEEYIKKYISLYAIDLLRTNSYYEINILITNIGRWNKLSNKFIFSSIEQNYANFIFVLLDIYKSLFRSKMDTIELKKIKEIYGNFELMVLYQDYSQLIDYAICYKKSNIIDKLIDYEPALYFTIIDDYGISVPKNVIMKGDKLLKLINRIKLE